MSQANKCFQILTVIAWCNFGLLVAGALKFVPLLVSYSHGVNLTLPQLEQGLLEDRLWAIDLVSDTHYLLIVWGAVAFFIHFLSGDARLLPWKRTQIATDKE